MNISYINSFKMSGCNKNLNNAKKAKKDKFYTTLSDIEVELKEYVDCFKGKVVYCNCDSKKSSFYQYFKNSIGSLGISKVIFTNFSSTEKVYKTEITYIDNKVVESVTALKQNGDFRSDECVEILKESDVVVSNPPFSLFREFIDLMFEYGKKFLVIGSHNAITYKNCFKYIKDNRLWLGVNKPKDFSIPYEPTSKIYGYDSHNNPIIRLGFCVWFTNLAHKKRNEPMILYRTYNEKDYPKYDDYDAIEVSRTKDIPKDYEGVIGVPITFMNTYCPEQFEIVDANEYCLGKDINSLPARPFIRGKQLYGRIFIKNKMI